jgi:hypothetical protein
MAEEAVSNLRTEVGRDPTDKRLSTLVGELATQSSEFRQMWAAHSVRRHRGGRKHLHHPVAGDLELDYETLELPAEPGLTVTVYTASPGSESADALRFLSSWHSAQKALTSATGTVTSTRAPHADGITDPG